MKTNLITVLFLIIGFAIFTSCNNQYQGYTPVSKQENEEYETALKLLNDFSMQENVVQSRSKSSTIQIKHVEKKSISCSNQILYSKNMDKDSELDLYIFTIEKEGKEGFAMVTGDRRIPQVAAYVEYGTLADTALIPEMAFVVRNIENSLKYDLQLYYKDEGEILTKNQDQYDKVETNPLVKTTWDVGSPYNNNYDFGGCSTPNQKYKASSTAIAFAQAIVANKKRPSAFPSNYNISQWLQKSKVEATDPYVSQVAELIYNLEGGTNLGCNVSYCDLLISKGNMTYYGYSDQEFTYGNGSIDYVNVVKNLKQGYCTIAGGKTINGSFNTYYCWVIDGFKGLINKGGTTAKLAQAHCVYSYGGKGNGWYANPFNEKATDTGKDVINSNLQFIYFRPF